ncbi:MAG TPA: lipid-A-disaccharide synthase [Thermodesulfovibrionales bacterium]|nr:lipid-A-disaccharide synthase [Thermodesulfovibrionales bacterium]
MKTVMIVAGESSGEWYGSLLAGELKRFWPGIRVLGIGGSRMREAGVEILAGISSAFGIAELLPSLRKIRESFRLAVKAITETRPEVVVLIDFPDFNFRLGRVAKRYGLKVLYYVSPQVWAWRKGRIRVMGEIADRVAVLLPFEEEMYRKAGIPSEFVGHPAMEEIEEARKAGDLPDSDKPVMRRKLGLAAGQPVVALLPGSRPHELRTLMPVFLDLVKQIKAELPESGFVMPIAPNIDVEKFRRYIDALTLEGVLIVKGNSIECLACSDLAVIASGTATLQATLLGVPFVVVYKVSPVTYLIGRVFVSVRHISLVNIISDSGVVRELIQRHANAQDIMQELRRILFDEQYRLGMTSSFEKVRRIFAGKRPSRRVAEMIGEMAGWELQKVGGPSGRD